MSSQESEESIPVNESESSSPAAEGEPDGGSPRRESATGLTVVGLGASAGGVEALEEFFGGVTPTEAHAAFLVQMRPAADADGRLIEALRRATDLDVQPVTKPVRAVAGHVYVLPPGGRLAVEDGVLSLAEPEPSLPALPDAANGAIDLFFRALAADFGPQASGVVLSGEGSDGTLGLGHIKEAGGLTVAQSPGEASHAAMPRNAIAAGKVDFVLPARDIAPQIAQYWDTSRRMRMPSEAAPSPRQRDDGPAAERAFRAILQSLREQTGHDFSQYKRATVLRRVGRRLQVNNLEDLPTYLAFLRRYPTEAWALLQDLLISVTQFFRDSEAWETLERDVAKDGALSPTGGLCSLSVSDYETGTIRRLAALMRETPDPAGSRQLLTASLEELAASLEALHLAAEAMHEQNGALAQARADLETEGRRYRDLLESDPDACIITDAHGCVCEANRQAHALLHAGPRSLVGCPLTKFLAPAERRAIFQEMALDGQATGTEMIREMRLAPAGRCAAPLAVSVSVSKMPGMDGVSGLRRWRFRPMPVQREMERHHALVAEVRDYAIILMDKEGRILDWNSGAEQLFGYEVGEVRGKSLDLIFTPEDRAQGTPAREMEAAERDGRTADDRWLMRKDGSQFWAGGSVMPLFGETGQEVRGFAKVLQDRTAQKLAQEEADDRLRHACHIADTFQRALVPEAPTRSFPRLAVAARYESAWEEARVGGDFYDVFPLPGGRVALAVGDVAGKGLKAALRASEIKTALRALAREETDPAIALYRANAFVCDLSQLDGIEEYLYTALTLVVLDPETGALTVALAGADPALILRRDGSVETCGTWGVLLGVKPGQAYRTASATLGPGDRLLMVTDGLTEARCPGFPTASPEAAFFGMAGVTRCAMKFPKSLEDLCADVVRGAHDFAGGQLTDDVCVLAAERL